MDFSIVICTHNRADSLERTLLGIFGMSLPAGCEWELIVVDNLSTDQTVDVCQKYEALIPLRYLREDRQGKSYALNSGLAAARADLILLTDDDVDVDPGWASAMLAAANTHYDADFFGGKVISRWQSKPPKWFSDNADMIRSNPRVDLGEAPVRFTKADEPRLIGANLAARKGLFDAGFMFRDDLGPSGEGGTGGRVGPEEQEWQQRLLRAGYEGVYVPDARVHHRDPPWRMTEKYLRHWYTQGGRVRVRQGDVPRGNEWMGAPRYLWKEWATNAATYLTRRLIGPSRLWLSAECRMCIAWGSIAECRASGNPNAPKENDPHPLPPEPQPAAAPTMEGTPAAAPSAHNRYRREFPQWLNRILVHLGPAAYIALHWPWPMDKPYMRRSLTVQALGGGLGDELMCLPVIAEIKRLNPKCRVRFVTRRPDFFRTQPHIDEVAKERPGRRVLKLVYNSVLPPPRPLITLMAECVGISDRFRRIPTLDVKPGKNVVKLIKHLPRPLVVVQPLATGWTGNKNWPLPYWIECVRSLTADFHVVEVGNDPVLPVEEMGPRFTSVSGGTTLHDLAYVISQADLFIGPSSGGMHLASAFDVPALIIFGGYERPSGYDYRNVEALYTPVACAPCWRQTCPYELMCLHSIKPETVVARARQMLGQKPAAKPAPMAAQV